MNAVECWFCSTPIRGGRFLRFDMYRNAQYTPLLVAVHARWEQAWVNIPRCERCGFGHGVERVTRWILAGSAVVTVLPTLLMTGSYLGGEPWADSWQIVYPWIWTLAWLGLWLGIRQHRIPWRRLAPRPERHARAHPGVRALAEEGWKPGGPFGPG
ncbi:hypothetical protein LG943_05925 [Streptomonospora sp. S1-112]|uniref:Uncharacterized protein n=1 Tax=Streptomonospora mangrovi TaxID=2883123 RepID=A0A9X3NKR4_9ACTN|nr:hypothetical protein [Streptomonospora mangrovi]MDA0563866.1 hypothetical protein [Streptomonospora mangrovi]